MVKCVGSLPLSAASCFKSIHKNDGDINVGFNDRIISKWLGLSEVKLRTKFSLKNVFAGSEAPQVVILHLDRIDSNSKIFINNRTRPDLLTNSSFVDFKFQIEDLVGKNSPENELEIILSPPVLDAAYAAKSDAHALPPNCPPDVQHGQCHVNRLRRPQFSFSWDWGPNLPDSGIFKPPVIFTNGDQPIKWRLQMISSEQSEHQKVRLEVWGEEMNLKKLIFIHRETKDLIETTCIQKLAVQPLKETWNCELKKVALLWWPNTHGHAHLYNARIEYKIEEKTKTEEKLFGFRTVELIQDPLLGRATSDQGDPGRSFYFKINGKPIFMSGSNWIPASAYLSEIIPKYENLLKSASQAGINMLRVWGGGIYESEEFYDLAAIYGIAIWQDFMFACATYADSPEFRSSVKNEVEHQLWRLGDKPGIIAWSGNNENEAALATNWYGTDQEKEFYYRQYFNLYIDTIKKEFEAHDLSVPFVTSSPTNGKKTEEYPYFIADNPYDPNYGDVHYYNYKDDCRDWRNFPKARFVSEFGYQERCSSGKIIQKLSKSFPENFSVFHQMPTFLTVCG